MKFLFLIIFLMMTECLIAQNSTKNEPGIDEFVEVDEPASVVSRVFPVYPDTAKQAGIEGKVFIKALIDESGSVARAFVMQGDDVFRNASLDAIRRTKFKPAMRDHRPIKCWVIYPFSFKLKY